jgi:hypothetical protein
MLQKHHTEAAAESDLRASVEAKAMLKAKATLEVTAEDQNCVETTG